MTHRPRRRNTPDRVADPVRNPRAIRPGFDGYIPEVDRTPTASVADVAAARAAENARRMARVDQLAITGRARKTKRPPAPEVVTCPVCDRPDAVKSKDGTYIRRHDHPVTGDVCTGPPRTD